MEVINGLNGQIYCCNYCDDQKESRTRENKQNEQKSV